MIKYCKQNNEIMKSKIKYGLIDYAHLSTTNLADDIISTMNTNGVLQCLEDGIDDIRANNYSIPFKIILGFIIAAKMKHKMSLSDVPTAITNHKLLGELGYNLIDTGGNLGTALMSESGLRYLFKKYDPFHLIHSYNNTVQNYITPKLNLSPNIHILDCTNIEVILENANYEWSAVAKDKKGKKARGYKLANLRGVTYDTGFIEDIRFGQLSTHDIELSREMLFTSPVLKHGDILICDRGFIDRKTINYLKNQRGVDTYQPLNSNMHSYKEAVSIAKKDKKWMAHPNKKRESQKIAFVPNLGGMWGNQEEDDVDINACVVWDTKDNEYMVFITTDLSKTAKDIIKTYELRPEIEEQYRQLKDFWGLQEFTCTDLSLITFHITFTLFAYLFFELYTMMPEGEEYLHKSFPVLLNNYKGKTNAYIMIYFENIFGIFTVIELMEIYSECNIDTQKVINGVLKLI